MAIIDNSAVETFELPGLKHQTVAGHQHGLKTVEVWMQTIAPHSATPVHRHNCEEVIVVLSGSGECTVAGETFTFGPNSTLIMEPDVVHRITNTSDEEMKLVASFAMAPVQVKTEDNEPMPLPWDAA